MHFEVCQIKRPDFSGAECRCTMKLATSVWLLRNRTEARALTSSSRPGKVACDVKSRFENNLSHQGVWNSGNWLALEIKSLSRQCGWDFPVTAFPALPLLLVATLSPTVKQSDSPLLKTDVWRFLAIFLRNFNYSQFPSMHTFTHYTLYFSVL